MLLGQGLVDAEIRDQLAAAHPVDHQLSSWPHRRQETLKLFAEHGDLLRVQVVDVLLGKNGHDRQDAQIELPASRCRKPSSTAPPPDAGRRACTCNALTTGAHCGRAAAARPLFSGTMPFADPAGLCDPGRPSTTAGFGGSNALGDSGSSYSTAWAGVAAYVGKLGHVPTVAVVAVRQIAARANWRFPGRFPAASMQNAASSSPRLRTGTAHAPRAERRLLPQGEPAVNAPGSGHA